MPSHSLKSGRHKPYGKRMRSGRSGTRRPTPRATRRAVQPCPLTSDSRAAGRGASRDESAPVQASPRASARCAADRASEHPADGAGDSGACAGCSRCWRRRVRRPRRSAAKGLSSWVTTSGGSYSMRAPAPSARTRYSISSPDDAVPSEPSPSVRRSGRRDPRTRPQEDRERDRPVPEVVSREQRRSRCPRRRRMAVLVHRPSREPVELRVARIGWLRVEQPWGVDAVVVRKRDEIGSTRSSATLRARERPRGERRTSSRTGGRSSTVASRSSSFWSTRSTRKPRWVWASRESRSRSSSATRSTVATTRSNDGSLSATGRTLTSVPLVSVLLAVHNDARFVGEAVSSMLGRPSRPRADRRRRRFDRRDAGDTLGQSTTRGCA